MLREVVLFLCVAGFVSAITHPNPADEDNQASQSEAVTSEASSSQPQQDIPVEAKILQSRLGVNAQSAPTFTNEQPAQYADTSSSVNAYVASPDIRYSISPAIVSVISQSAPAPEDKKVTVEEQEEVAALPPTATKESSDPVTAAQPVQPDQTVVNRPAVQYVSAPLGQSQDVQTTGEVSSNVVQQTVTARPPSPVYVNSALPQFVGHIRTVPLRSSYQYAPISVSQSRPGIVKSVSVIPEKEITVETHQSATAHPPTATYVTSRPVVVQPVYYQPQFVAKPPAIKYVPVPVEHRYPALHTVTAFPPSAAYISPTAGPLPIREVKISSKPVKPVLVRPVASAPSKSVTVESHQSVTAHPRPQYIQTFAAPPPVQYVAAAPSPIAAENFAQYGGSFVNYVPPPIVAKPIPVPVIYSPGAPQFVAVAKPPQPAQAIVAVNKPIPVPVAYPKSEAFINYKPGVDTTLVYSKSLVEKNHASADLVSTHITPNYGYARALSYSPAAAVSSVSFNGLGVSYGW